MYQLVQIMSLINISSYGIHFTKFMTHRRLNVTKHTTLLEEKVTLNKLVNDFQNSNL